MPHPIKLSDDEAVAELKQLKLTIKDIIAAVMADKVTLSPKGREAAIARHTRRVAALKMAIEALGGSTEHVSTAEGSRPDAA